MIVSLDGADAELITTAADLHCRLLPGSPVSRLGRFFMTRFYYSTLVRDGLVRCDLFSHEGRYVGFSAYTDVPLTFMERGLKRHTWRLLWVLAISLLAKPSRLGILLGTARLSGKRKIHEDDGRVGECLSLGVLPEYGTVKDERTGLRISHQLFNRVKDYFKGKGFREILLVIDKQNRHALTFYYGYGAVLKPADYVPAHCCLMSVELGR